MLKHCDGWHQQWTILPLLACRRLGCRNLFAPNMSHADPTGVQSGGGDSGVLSEALSADILNEMEALETMAPDTPRLAPKGFPAAANPSYAPSAPSEVPALPPRLPCALLSALPPGTPDDTWLRRLKLLYFTGSMVGLVVVVSTEAVYGIVLQDRFPMPWPWLACSCMLTNEHMYTHS